MLEFILAGTVAFMPEFLQPQGIITSVTNVDTTTKEVSRNGRFYSFVEGPLYLTKEEMSMNVTGTAKSIVDMNSDQPYFKVWISSDPVEISPGVVCEEMEVRFYRKEGASYMASERYLGSHYLYSLVIRRKSQTHSTDVNYSVARGGSGFNISSAQRYKYEAGPDVGGIDVDYTGYIRGNPYRKSWTYKVTDWLSGIANNPASSRLTFSVGVHPADNEQAFRASLTKLDQTCSSLRMSGRDDLALPVSDVIEGEIQKVVQPHDKNNVREDYIAIERPLKYGMDDGYDIYYPDGTFAFSVRSRQELNNWVRHQLQPSGKNVKIRSN